MPSSQRFIYRVDEIARGGWRKVDKVSVGMIAVRVVWGGVEAAVGIGGGCREGRGGGGGYWARGER